MNLGKLLGVAMPGLSATGLFGHKAQGSGTATLGAMSPLLALLLHHKQSGGAVEQTPVVTAPNAAVAAPTAPPAPQAQGVQSDADKRRQMGLRLLQLGGQFASPFGQRY